MLRAIRDPIERARKANKLATHHRAAAVEIARIRTETLRELAAGGLSHAEIADLTDMGRVRVTQLITARRTENKTEQE